MEWNLAALAKNPETRHLRTGSGSPVQGGKQSDAWAPGLPYTLCAQACAVRPHPRLFRASLKPRPEPAPAPCLPVLDACPGSIHGGPTHPQLAVEGSTLNCPFNLGCPNLPRPQDDPTKAGHQNPREHTTGWPVTKNSFLGDNLVRITFLP